MVELQTRQNTTKVSAASKVNPEEASAENPIAKDSSKHEDRNSKPDPAKMPPCPTKHKEHKHNHDCPIENRSDLRERVRNAITSLNQISQRVTERIARSHGEEKALVDKAYNKELLQTSNKKSDLYKYTGDAQQHLDAKHHFKTLSTTQGNNNTSTSTAASLTNKSSLVSQIQVFIHRLQSLNLLTKLNGSNETLSAATSLSKTATTITEKTATSFGKSLSTTMQQLPSSTTALSSSINKSLQTGTAISAKTVKQLGGLGARFNTGVRVVAVTGLGLGGAKLGGILGGLLSLVLPGMGTLILASIGSVLGLLGGCFLALRLTNKLK